MCAAVLAVVALTAGCAGEPAAAPPASTATTTTTTVPPSPAELNERAKAAIAPPGAFDSLGGAVKVSNPANDGDAGLEGEAVTTVCNDGALRADDFYAHCETNNDSQSRSRSPRRDGYFRTRDALRNRSASCPGGRRGLVAGEPV
jgi:hypothetical protein